MPVYTESTQYAEDRLQRIEARLRHHYSRSYYIRRACDSATRRMSNVSKLAAWAEVLEAHGYEECARYCRRRIEGLGSGTIAAPTRRRLGRTQVARYVSVGPLRPHVVDAPSMVEFVVADGGDTE